MNADVRSLQPCTLPGAMKEHEVPSACLGFRFFSRKLAFSVCKQSKSRNAQHATTRTSIAQEAARRPEACPVLALFSNSCLKKTCFRASGIPGLTSKDAKDAKPDVLEPLADEA